MSPLEFLEELPAAPGRQRWLVLAEGCEEPRVAWLVTDDDPEWLARTEVETRPWIGPLHPRVTQIFESRWLGGTLAFVVDDDRGPLFTAAAAQLADPIQRERWSVAQIIAIGDALATMRQRDRDFVHRQLEPGQLFVDAAGHARLYPPIAVVAQGPRPAYTGRSRSFGSPGAWASLSPEQCRGLPLAPASDVFSLAGILVAALTGRAPFRRDSDFTTLQAIIQDAPPAIAADAPGLAEVIARALEKDPRQRYPDPGTFAGELWRCVPDAAEFDEVISDRIAAWWPTAQPAPRAPALPSDRCRVAWDALRPTDSDGVRHCASCGQDVVRVTSIAAVVALAGRRCVSYPGGE